MKNAVVQIILLGLSLVLVTALPNKDDWDIYSFRINSTVTSRYATTVITSRVANRMNESKEIEFQVRIPKNAFISKFRMFMDGQVFDGVVKAKEEAQQQYTEAVSRGESAGLVSSVGRTLEEFKTSVAVAAHKKVTFELTYEELLKRTLGKYELQIYARPMQPVKDFKLDVNIHEEAGINFITVKGGLALADAITQTHEGKQASVHFYPTEEQQRTCVSCGEQGMNGDLVIVYDVNRNTSLGDIKTSDGYFVHHFAPTGLPRIPKNVVFLIDRSGSMHGRKIEQTRIALVHILNDLAEDDFFGLVTFDSAISHWKRELVQATQSNLDSAKNFAQGITDRGATDINEAVLEGAKMLNVHPRQGSASILILLTDGDPTTGVTNLETIQSNVRKAINDKFPLYCLGFGFDVNFEFLKKMSLQNNGVARRIYEDSDANLQLKGFYEEVATPLLTDVTMIYTGGINLTKTNFSQYYNGSEIVVAGQITDNDIETFTPQVVAISGARRVKFSDTDTMVESPGTVSGNHLQRVWAYLTVKQLLEKELQLSGAKKEDVTKEALRLSLKYSFVTPLTSMVVTKPPGEEADVLYKPKEDKPSQGDVFRSPSRSYLHHGSRRGQAGPPSGFSPGGLPGQPDDFSQIVEVLSSSVQADPLPKAPAVSKVQRISSPAYDYDSVGLPVRVASRAPVNHRFLLKTKNQSLPLCFDVRGDSRLKLLHLPNSELLVNGKLDTVTEGFKKIVIRFKSDKYVEITANEITAQEGLRRTLHTGQDPILLGSMTVIRRGNEINVTSEGTHLIILVHEKNSKQFLWPLLREQPSDNNAEGILAVKPAVYEEIQQSSSTKFKIKDQEIDVSRSSAADYTSLPPLVENCWLMSPESALQRRLRDFIVSRL